MKSVATITAALMLAAASTVSAAAYFSIDFEGNAVGDNYTSVAGVGTNTNLVGALPSNITYVNPTGSFALTVQTAGTGKLLDLSGTAVGGNQSFLDVFSPQAAPAVPETWFVQFDYTRLATTSGVLGVNFQNSSGQNMLGHPNTQTLYPDSWDSPNLAVDATHTLRLEIDSGTTIGRAYVNGVKFHDFTNISNANSFGGIRINTVSGTVTDFKIDNISGGVVPEPMSLSVLGLGAVSLLMARKRK